MNLYPEIVKVWEEGNCNIKVGLWATSLEACLDEVKKKRNNFHQSGRIMVYISYSMATARTPTFSLRFLGQEVGKLLSSKENEMTRLQVTNQHVVNTMNSFDIQLTAGKSKWTSMQARGFRKSFNNLKKSTPHSTEHWVESRFLQEMMKRAGINKFGGTFKNIQPVLLSGCPFQCPVPIGASEGKPMLSPRANVDILARLPGGRLSVWELKRPGVAAHSLDQVYIYAVTLAKMLRSGSGEKWFRFFGFTRKIPKIIKIDAFIAVSSDQRKAIQNRIKNFVSPLLLPIEQAEIRLFAAYYEWDSKTEKLIINSIEPLAPSSPIKGRQL